jgi:hypothetical protein
MGQAHPQAVAGYASAQLAQSARSFLDLTAAPERVSYWDVVTTGSLDLRKPR